MPAKPSTNKCDKHNSMVNRHIGTAYDTVKIVADNIDIIEEMGGNLPYLLKYLGAYSTPPTQRPDGSSLQDGDYYFDSTSEFLAYYNFTSTTWFIVNPQEILDARGAAIEAQLAAEDAQTAAELAETNAESSAAAAALSEGNAATSATDAAASALSAAQSEANIDAAVTESQNDIVGGSIFKGSNDEYVQNGDEVPSGTTHLRVLVGGNPTIVAMSPISSGVVSLLTDVGATIGTNTVEFQPLIKLTPLKCVTDRVILSGVAVAGQKIEWQGYHAQSDGGSNWGIIKSGAHTEDGFSIFSIDSNTYIEANLKGKSLNIRKAGAKGDKVSDDTARINLVKDYAEANISGRFGAGQCIRVPTGNFRVNAATGQDAIRVISSRILIKGYGPEVSVLYAPDCDFTMLHLDGTALSLYGTSIKGIRFNTPGNATGTHLKTTRLIDSDNANLQFVGHYDGLVSDGCARTYFTNVIFTQDTRAPNTSPRYAMDFRSDIGNNSDVHVSTWQIFMPDDRKTAHSVSIRGADGIYFNNGHQQGGVIIQPLGHGLNVCATVSWTQTYFDKADAENVIFTGQSAAYRNFEFNQCYMRGSQKGLVFATAGPIEDIRWNGGRCANHTSSGVEMTNAFVSGVIINGVTLDSNCTSNNLGDSDILVRGDSHVFSTIVFRGGASNGRGLNLTNESSNCTSSGLDFTDSVQGIRYIDLGIDNRVGVLSGVTLKNKGTASIPAGSSSITVPHGMSVTPEIDSIFLQQRTTISPATNLWVSNITSTTFDVTLNSQVTDNAVISWLCDMTD